LDSDNGARLAEKLTELADAKDPIDEAEDCMEEEPNNDLDVGTGGSLESDQQTAVAMQESVTPDNVVQKRKCRFSIGLSAKKQKTIKTIAGGVIQCTNKIFPRMVPPPFVKYMRIPTGHEGGFAMCNPCYRYFIHNNKQYQPAEQVQKRLVREFQKFIDGEL
jgi:hypothetical protein